MTHKLVLLRHGESTWNHENRLTGWTDVDLSDRGRKEAREAGRKGGMASHRRRTELTGNQGMGDESPQNLESSDMSRRDDDSGEQIR